MRSTNGRARLAMTSLAVMAAIVAGGCSSGEAASGKAGGAAPPVVLKMVNAYGDLNPLPGDQYFVSQVKERSGGNLRIELTSGYGDDANDAEQQVVRAVAAGKADLGWAGARVFDTMGVTSFQALQAPMLIDSYPLEQAVIAAGIPDQMLEGLDKVGVTGLGVLVDGLRKPIAVKGPLLGAADWRGITFGTLRSQGQAEAIAALGASPLDILGRPRNEALSSGKLQGFEMNLLVYHGRVLAHAAPYVTANVNLWPQMDVLLGNPERLAELSDQQRGWLEEAARVAAELSVELVDNDAENLKIACQAGARFANASKEDLAALRDDFATVYTSLEQDAQTKMFIQQIQELKRSTPAGKPLAIPAGCSGKAPERADQRSASASGELNGTYRHLLTEEDARRVGDPEADQFPEVQTIRLRDSQVQGGCFGQGASYSVSGNQIIFNSPEYGYTMTFTFAVDGKGNLHLTPVQPMDPGDAFQCAYNPWIKIG
jgi:TRAP-type C4-dicarboxylate transport system substrate-binding protein